MIAEPRHFVFHYRLPQHFLDVSREHYGPVLKASEMLDATGRKTLPQDVIELIERFNRSGDASMIVPSEYLEVVMILQ